MKMRHHVVLVVLLAITIASCASSPAAAPAPLAECIRGWWLDSAPVRPCDGACGSEPTAECASSDCTEYSFFGFLDGGVYYEGRLSYSAQAGTMSSAHAATIGTYTVMDSSVHLTPSDWEPYTTCTGDELQQALVPWDRAPAGFASALDQATASGTSSTFARATAPAPSGAM